MSSRYSKVLTVAKGLNGISKASVANQITFQDYKNALFNNEIKTACNCRLNSKKHKMYLKEEHKLALDPFDDKRKILPDGITTEIYTTEANIEKNYQNLCYLNILLSF